VPEPDAILTGIQISVRSARGTERSAPSCTEGDSLPVIEGTVAGDAPVEDRSVPLDLEEPDLERASDELRGFALFQSGKTVEEVVKQRAVWLVLLRETIDQLRQVQAMRDGHEILSDKREHLDGLGLSDRIQ
jgi:hypothetical protein